jgi:hypothetical protein
MNQQERQAAVSKAAGLLREAVERLRGGHNEEAEKQINDAFSQVEKVNDSIVGQLQYMDLSPERDALDKISDELTTVYASLEDDVPSVNDLEDSDLDEICDILSEDATALEELEI